MATLKQIGRLLLNNRIHRRMAITGKLKCPHKFTIGTPTHFLFYYGGKHSTKPSHPQFTDIKKQWSDWLTKTDGKQRLAVIEGQSQGIYKNKKQAITIGAETGFLTYLADKNKVKVISLEPDRKSIDRQLLKCFNRDEIQFQYFACMAWQCVENYTWENPNVCLNKYLNNCKKISGWKDYDFSIKHMNKVCIKITGKSIKQHDSQSWNQLISPFNQKSPLRKLVLAELDLRDAYIVKNIIREFKGGNSIFILYSHQHAYRQEPALKKLLTTPTCNTGNTSTSQTPHPPTLSFLQS